MSHALLKLLTQALHLASHLLSTTRLVAVVEGLVGALDGDVEVVGLDLGEGGELDAELGKVGASDLLVEVLGEHVDTKGVRLNVGPEGDLGKNLVGERARHDKRGVASGTAKVDKTALGKEDEVTAALHEETVNLGLDVDVLDSVLLEPVDVNLNVKVTNVADNGVLGHGLEVLATDNVTASNCQHFSNSAAYPVVVTKMLACLAASSMVVTS